MDSKNNQQSPRGILPLFIATTRDVSNLRRQTESIDEFLRQAELRSPGTRLQLPKVSGQLEELAKVNQLNLLVAHDRTNLIEFLKILKEQAPKVHISFATEPSNIVLTKLIDWFRKNIDPHVLFQVGLQPTLAAGCVIRTKNKVFDFSLRQRLLKQRKVLTDKLNEVASA